jgi:DNA-binding NarL/FixJ family response regulator
MSRSRMRTYMPKPLRVVLADDERPARRFLVNLLRSFPDVDVVGEATNGRDRSRLITLLNHKAFGLAIWALTTPQPVRQAKRR